jgi:hypothetical protein
MSGEGLAERAREFFARCFPDLLARLERAGPGASAVVVEGGEAVDIRVEDRHVYGGNARNFAAEQVAAYMANPLRLYMSRLNASGLVSPVCLRLVKAMHAHLHTEHNSEIATYPVDSPTCLVVFGVGLGHHLLELARRTEARWLIIAEPFLEFIQHSFHVVDWEELVETFTRRGGTVHIVTEMDPGRMTAVIARIMSEHGIPYADGSWVFTHYPLWAFTESRKRLYEMLEFAFINRGFFEDELRMMSNAVENFTTRDFRLLEARPRLRRAETAAIVGAGPSLDEGIEALRRFRDRIVLFSCGTALRPLLRAGLVPDFHCELENVPEVVDALRATAECGNLAEIDLIATATVDPRVPPLFRETIFYFRDSVSSTQILGQKYAYVPVSSPTCVNMGLAMAAFLGFSDFVFFGTDCGIRPGVNRHAEGTIYRDIGVFQESDRNRSSPIEVEGNFGGIVRTDWVYDACRLMLANNIAHYRLNVVNCSDGAFIPGTQPRVPEALEIATPVIDRRAFHVDVRRPMTRFAAGEILREADIGAIAAHAERLFADLEEILTELAEGDGDFAASFRRMGDFLAAARDRYGYTDAIICGTLKALPRIAMFYGYRVPDGPLRRALYDLFINEFRAILETTSEKTRELFARLETLAPAPQLETAGAG